MSEGEAQICASLLFGTFSARKENIMPLDPKASVGDNISEFHKGPTYAATKRKFGKKKANAQAIAVAMATKRRGKKKPSNPPHKRKTFDQLS
jgi:hypothetical protein